MTGKLSLRGLTVAGAVIWAGVLFFVGAANLADAGYGTEFLMVVASLYPGYDGHPSGSQLFILVLYGLLDGGFCGLLIAWLYNLAAIPRSFK